MNKTIEKKMKESSFVTREQSIKILKEFEQVDFEKIVNNKKRLPKN